MSDVTEPQLRAAFQAKVGVVSPEVARRLGEFDYRAREGRTFTGVRLGVLASAGSAVIGALIVVIVALSSGATSAFAGWTAVPARVSTAALTQARTVCGDVPSTSVLAAEDRGPFVAIVFDRGGAPWQCITRGARVLLKQTTEFPARLYTTTQADRISTPSLIFEVYGHAAKRKLAGLKDAEARLIHTPGLRSKHLAQFSAEMSRLDDKIAAINTGPQSLIGVTGTAGPGVSEVKFIRTDRTIVSATVQHGWYEAWWPGSSTPGGADAARVRITTKTGTRSSKIAYGPIAILIARNRCANGTYCSVFATAALKPEIAPALKAHFAFFQNTPPTPASSLPPRLRQLLAGGPLRATLGASLGIDNAQARAIRLPHGGMILIVPGTEGVCVTTTGPRGPGGIQGSTGGCLDINGVLQWGEAGVSYESGGLSSDAQATYTLGGLLPNGNKTVAVRMATGATITVPVHDNIVYATFHTAVSWFRFKNAYGTEKNHPA